jgi:alkanesulfonate monooxygenase SsuD/methylene tetrahydromethanopterin reductase-like flavin-dependent oxidoreductase (luciferase family)
VGGSATSVQEKDSLLRSHCEAEGRDEREIERTVGMGAPLIRDTAASAHAAYAALFTHNGGAAPWEHMPVGTPDDVVEHCAAYVRQGYRHLIFGFPAPYDVETMTRLATEVRPRLAEMAGA